MAEQYSFTGFLIKTAENVFAGLKEIGIVESGFIEKNSDIILVSFWTGSPYLIQFIKQRIPDDISDLPLLTLKQDILKFVETFPLLTKESVTNDSLRKFAEVLAWISRDFVALREYPTAYNFAEFSYSIKRFGLGENCLDAAKTLLELADKTNTDQYRASLWKVAIERVAYALEHKKDWLEAIDAVELVLLIPPLDENLHKDLYQELMNVMGPIAGTPIECLSGLVMIFNPLLSQQQNDEILILAAEPNTPTISPDMREAVKILAISKLQCTIDDTRYDFIYNSQVASVNWHDVTLHHERLNAAVPLGQSLIYSLDRTATFILDMVHEITHAYCLIGMIGKTRNCLRVATHFCEFFLSDVKSIDFNEPIDPIKTINKTQISLYFSALQLSASWKAKVLESVWKPWLEGISMYFELLANPIEDETAISPVFSAIRSLIDWNPPKESELESDYLNRVMQEHVSAFEVFCNETYRKLSFLRHSGYVRKKSSICPEDPELYVMGYLLVRSVVSRWEQTIGRRIPPAVASKLLLHVTRGDGNVNMIPPLSEPTTTFKEACQNSFQNWVDSLHGFDKEILEDFFLATDPNSPGRTFYWEGGKTYPMKTDLEEKERRARLIIDQLAIDLQGLLSGNGLTLSNYMPEMQNKARSIMEGNAEKLKSIMLDYFELLTLLPIGEDWAKLNLDNPARKSYTINTRTYTGVRTEEAKQKEENTQRFSIANLYFKDNKETQQIIDLLTEQRLARVKVTKVIDLIGNPVSPTQIGFSYLCMFAGKKWSRISLGYLGPVFNESHKEFCELIHRRVFPPFFFTEEESTLSSLTFLKQRFTNSFPEQLVQEVDVDYNWDQLAWNTIVKCCAISFGYEEATWINDLRQVRNSSETMSTLSQLLYQSGTGDENWRSLLNSEPYNPFFSRIFDTTSFSGITPLNKST